MLAAATSQDEDISNVYEEKICILSQQIGAIGYRQTKSINKSRGLILLTQRKHEGWMGELNLKRDFQVNGKTSSKRRMFYLLSVMVMVSLIITISITYILYDYDFQEEQTHLLASIQNQKYLIEAVAKHDSIYSSAMMNENPNYDPVTAIISQISEAYQAYNFLMLPIEYTISRARNDSIIFLIIHANDPANLPAPVSMKSPGAESQKRALRGLTGVMISLNDEGEQILAAYTNVNVLNMGLVGTIKISEIQKPFIQAATIGAAIAAIILTLGAIIFFWLGNPIVRKLETHSHLAFEASILTNLNQAVNLVRIDGFEIIYTNKAFDTLFGYTKDELLGRKVTILNSPSQGDPSQQAREISESIAANGIWEGELLNCKKDGSDFWTHASVSIFPTQEGKEVLISVQRDISRIKVMSDALRRNEKLLNETGELGKIGGWEIDLETMTPIFTRETYNIHELNPDLPPPSVLEGLKNYPPEARPVLKKLANQAIEEHKSYDIELPFVTAKGKQLWVRTIGKVELEGDKAIRLYGIIQDITAIRKIQTTLRESEANLKEAQRIAKIGSYHVNLLTNTVEWSDEMYTILGVDKTSHMPTLENFAQFVHPDDEHIISQEAFKNSLKNQFHEFEYRILTLDKKEIKHIQIHGETFHNADGKPFAIAATFQDITDQKNAELEILERDEINRAITDSATDAIISIDEWGSVISWNSAAENMFGRKSSDMIGQNFMDIIPEKYRDQHTERLKALSEGGQSHFIGKTIELSGRRYNGDDFPIELSLSRWKKGIAVHYTGIIRDISERKKAESKQELLEAQLRQAQKLEAVGTMAGGIAHDFNNILQSQLLHSQIIARQLTEDSKIAKNINHIIDAGKRAQELVRRILAFSREGEVKYSTLNLQDVLDETLGLVDELLPSNIELHTYINQVASPVIGDKNQLQQVVLNLCNNASHAIGPRGGQITITLKEISSSEQNESSLIELVVSDTGCGMNQKTLDRVFDPFFTTKGVGEGTGLGLSLIHGIITDMHGEIIADSTEGVGSEFRVRLPVARLKPSDVLPGTISDPVFFKGSVLLVDDEADILSAARQTLEALGLQVTTEQDGESALMRFSDEYSNLDVVIIDLMMPQMTGLEFSKKALEISPLTPIILMSGMFSPESMVDCEKLGIQRLQKPWSEDDIVDVLKALNIEVSS